MNRCLYTPALAAMVLIPFGAANANRDTRTEKLFQAADQSAEYFQNGYVYAVFPTIGKGGLMYSATVAGHKFSYTSEKAL